MAEVDRPSLSVVIVVFTGAHNLKRCLESLSHQQGDSEILVAHDDRFNELGGLRESFPRVDFVGAIGRRTTAQLRSMGVAHAAGEIVALTEDHCIPGSDWCEQIRDAHTSSTAAAIGGAVEKAAPDTALNWALYFADYLRYMRPFDAGRVSQLTDLNVSYKRTALGAVSPVWAEEFHEPQVHAALLKRGEMLWLSPRMIVRQKRSLELRSALADRVAYGRLFGSTRIAGESKWRRYAWAALCIPMPALLWVRLVIAILRKGRFRLEFARAAPALVLINAAWVIGELTGYLTGRGHTGPIPAGEPAS